MKRNPYPILSTFSLLALCVSGVSTGTGTKAQNNGTSGEKPKLKPITVEMELSQKALDMEALGKSHIGYMPTGIELVAEKPTAITKEPAYAGKPKYGGFVLGNDPTASPILLLTR